MSSLEIRRLPHTADLALNNAISELVEAAIVIRQFMPESNGDNDMALYVWDKQLSKLKMAIGLAGNVREMISRDNRFRPLNVTHLAKVTKRRRRAT